MEGITILKVEVKRLELYLELLSLGLYKAPNYYLVKRDETLKPMLVKALNYEDLCHKLIKT